MFLKKAMLNFGVDSPILRVLIQKEGIGGAKASRYATIQKVTT
jgi:hypothetical protein